MNLVQINERLKDLPMQVVQQYANGMNPEVPPYLALGELQRRETAQKQMATAQGAQQGPQPSVKEQVEQKAGLMQLQQMQQQQMAQQQAQPQGPMPVPAGAPQPQMQPEAPQAMMARGGLAGIPVRRDMFEYARGGIIAFAGGGEVDAAREEAKAALAKLRTYGLRQRQQDPEGYKAAEEAAAAAQEKRQAIEAAYAQEMSSSGVDRPATSRRDVGAVREAMQQAPEAPMVTSQGPGTPVVPRRPIEPASGIAAALTKAAPVAGAAQPPAAPRPSAIPPAMPPAQAGAQPNVSPFLAEAATMAREKPVAPTAEGIKSEVSALMPAGLQEAAQQKMFEDQRARADERKATFEKTRPSGLDDLIRVFGQSGQFKGGTGFAPAYTANQDRKRAQELAFQKEQDELLTAIDTRRTAADEKLFGARTGAMTAANKAFQDRLLTNTKSLADLAGVDQRRMDEALNRLSQENLEKLRITARAAEAARPGEAERIEAKYMGMIAKGQVKEAEEYLSRIAKIKGGAGGDRNPTPTDRLRAAQSIMNDIDSTAEEKAMAKREIASIMAGNKPGGEGGAAGAPPAAIDALRKNPGLAAQFDQKYGKGAAAQYLQK